MQYAVLAVCQLPREVLGYALTESPNDPLTLTASSLPFQSVQRKCDQGSVIHLNTNQTQTQAEGSKSILNPHAPWLPPRTN